MEELTNVYRKQESYKTSFEAFLKNTDEKLVLSQELNDLFAKLNIKSVLDIGAGNGELSRLISPNLERYVAIEQRPDFVEKLRTIEHPNISVFKGDYPIQIEEKFDAVLFSHSLPIVGNDKSAWQEFIDDSLENLKIGGRLVIVTYEAGNSDWSKLIDQAELPRKNDRTGQIDLLANFLQSKTEVEVKEIITHVKAQTVNELMNSLAFVYSDGKEEKVKIFLENEKIREQLEANYKDGTSYSFPFRHYLVVAKPNQ